MFGVGLLLVDNVEVEVVLSAYMEILGMFIVPEIVHLMLLYLYGLHLLTVFRGHLLRPEVIFRPAVVKTTLLATHSNRQHGHKRLVLCSRGVDWQLQVARDASARARTRLERRQGRLRMGRLIQAPFANDGGRVPVFID